jgi:putative ABC transport system permease protein
MQARALSSTLTGFSMALGVALVISVMVIYGVVERQFNAAAQGYHLIVGAKGGKLQLVLNTVYHLSQPIENIPYSYYKEFTEGRFASSTKLAVPYCLGDSYLADGQTFRVVGTTPDMFDKLEYGRTDDGQPLKYEFQEGGRNFKADAFFEAVLGSVVANASGLKVGDQFLPAHGIVEEGDEAKIHRGFQIVGILEPTGTPNDRALFVNMEGFYLLDGHAKPVNESVTGEEPTPTAPAEEPVGEPVDGAAPMAPLPENQREVTSILVLCSSDLVSQLLFRNINEGQVAQAAYPAREVSTLFERIVGPIQLILLVLTVLIVIVAGIGIMVSIYNSMSERSHEIAVMRALGAGRSTVMAVIVLESILLSLTGGAAGMLLGHGMLGIVSPWVVRYTGVSLHALQFDWLELTLIPGLVVLAAIIGLVPALSAYRTDVAKALSANP